ncbi:MAG: hypothetical protein DYG89_37260 [Caldilinea sp. CFX5]|nr:hypothetical protein [Caldilinea sp. CFX5]
MVGWSQYAIAMTHYIQRTVTITIIETLTLLWVCTNHDDAAPTRDAPPPAPLLVACSTNRITSTVNTAMLPAPTKEAQK